VTDSYLQLRKLVFSGPIGEVKLDFVPGVNVICGASDTGKSFLAESIDFMLGGSSLREIPERTKFGDIELHLAVSNGENWQFNRAVSGGDFKLVDLNNPNSQSSVKLKQSHGHDKTDNLSGFLLDKIGLIGKRILKSSKKGTTQSLSFRNLARLAIIQEGEIQQTGSPFWGGQFTLKTAELAAIKLLLTGVDDSSVIATSTPESDNSKQIALIDELLADLIVEIADIGEEESELAAQLSRLENSIDLQRESLGASQQELDSLLSARREIFEQRQKLEVRSNEIEEHLARFELLREHYEVDIARLNAIQESGSMFAHIKQTSCPLCGAPPNAQHVVNKCDGDVIAIVQAASSEIQKIARLKAELSHTVAELQNELIMLRDSFQNKSTDYDRLDSAIQQTVAPQVGDERVVFSALVEKRASVQRSVELYTRKLVLEERKLALLQEDEDIGERNSEVVYGIPIAIAHDFSKKLSTILKAWDFPGDCLVHFDNSLTDFVIDGKPRGSRGKGLRAITHAAVTIGLLEYCQEHGLSHPGFVVLDSPLLAYFKPEGDDDFALKGTDLKERFYKYLVEHHATESQIIIIENQHPPLGLEDELAMTVFTGNPNEGRFGFL
jgi:hypothetical protein